MTTNDTQQTDLSTEAMLMVLAAEMAACPECNGNGGFGTNDHQSDGSIDTFECEFCKGTGEVPLFDGLRKDCPFAEVVFSLPLGVLPENVRPGGRRPSDGIEWWYVHSDPCQYCQDRRWLPAAVDVGQLMVMAWGVLERWLKLEPGPLGWTGTAYGQEGRYKWGWVEPTVPMEYHEHPFGAAIEALHAAVKARKEALE